MEITTQRSHATHIQNEKEVKIETLSEEIPSPQDDIVEIKLRETWSQVPGEWPIEAEAEQEQNEDIKSEVTTPLEWPNEAGVRSSPQLTCDLTTKYSSSKRTTNNASPSRYAQPAPSQPTQQEHSTAPAHQATRYPAQTIKTLLVPTGSMGSGKRIALRSSPGPIQQLESHIIHVGQTMQ